MTIEQKLIDRLQAADDRMKADSELLPCPFCGSQAEFVAAFGMVDAGDVRCSTRDCYLHFGAQILEQKGAAIAMWNRRALQREQRAIASQAIKALDAAGALAFITCESGPSSPPQVVAKFRHIQDAQEYHRALVRCGEVARMIEAEDQSSE